MKHLKKIIPPCLLALVLIVGITLLTPQPQAATSGTCGTFLTWTLDGSGVLTISGTNTMYSFLSDSDVPWYDVRASIQSVVIEPGVVSIGERAFKDCTNLQSVTIPDTVTTIGAYAFQGCSSLESVTISKRVTEIGNYVFQGCSSLQSITIPDSVTEIGNYVFSGCTGLQSVTIPDNVTFIGACAFYNCSSLQAINIPTSITKIYDDAFYGCSSLTGVYITDVAAWCKISFGHYFSNPLYYAHNLYLNGALVTALTIPDSITKIDDYAFRGCSSLESVTIPESVTKIDYCAFSYCTGLTDVYYTGTEEQWNRISISNYNDSLTSANIHYNHTHDYTLIPPVTVQPTCTEAGYIEYTCMYGDTYREELPALGHLVGQDTVTIAPTCTQQGYTQSTCPRCGVVAESDYTASLGHDFSGTQTVVAATCTEQGYTVTQCIRCDAVEKSNYTAVLSHNVVVIALCEPTCTEPGVSSIGTMCDRCQTVFVAPTYTPALGHSFVNGVCTVCQAEDPSSYCGDNLTWTLNSSGTLTITGTGPMYDWAYNQAAPWADKKASIKAVVINSGVTTIGDYAFHFCPNLEEVTIADTVTTIGVNAFDDCSALRSVTFGKGITAIEQYAFFGCESLQNIALPTSLATIGDSAFAYCSNLQAVSIPSSVTRIDGAAFVHCTSLQSISLPDGLATISESTFAWCSALQSVTIPDSITTIDASAFLNCNNLQDVYYMGNQAQWENVAISKDNDPLRNANIHFAAQEAGDMDGSGEITNDDVVALMWHVLFPDDNPISGNGDFNHDNSVDNNDVILLMWHILFPEENPL